MARELSASKLGVLVALAMPLAACGTTDRIKTGSDIPLEDYRARHPITIAEATTSIDVFPSTAQGRLDLHSAKQIYAFAQQYRDTGRGTILILLPNGTGDHRDVVDDMKSALAAGGAHAKIDVSTYPVADPTLAAPVRLSFSGIKAQVADQCGQWPNDLASGSSVDSWQNKNYWNFGCATQSMIAAQTSDPRDLVTPRGEEAADTQIRSRAIDSIRKGTDPNTAWSVKNSNIGTVGGS